MSKKRISKVAPYPKAIQDSFINNLEGMETFVKNVEPIVAKYDQKVIRVTEYMKKAIKEIITSKVKPDIEVKQGEGGNLQIDEGKVEKATEGIMQVLIDHKRLPRMTVGQVELLYRSAFVMLTAFLDYLIHDVIHCYYITYPESLSDKDKELSISLSDLKLCADRDEAMDMIVDKKVDSILYGNLVS